MRRNFIEPQGYPSTRLSACRSSQTIMCDGTLEVRLYSGFGIVGARRLQPSDGLALGRRRWASSATDTPVGIAPHANIFVDLQPLKSGDPRILCATPAAAFLLTSPSALRFTRALMMKGEAVGEWHRYSVDTRRIGPVDPGRDQPPRLPQRQPR